MVLHDPTVPFNARSPREVALLSLDVRITPVYGPFGWFLATRKGSPTPARPASVARELFFARTSRGISA